MANEIKRDRGELRIDGNECKGCGLCIEACPPKVISMSERLNHYGYKTAVYAGKGLHGLRHLLHGLPGAGSDYGVPAGERPRCGDPAGESAVEGATECASN